MYIYYTYAYISYSLKRLDSYMRKTFYIPGKAISINSTYYANKNHGMTVAAKEWFENFYHNLNLPKNQAGLSELRNAFDASVHSFKLSIIYYVPESELYNKQGLLSSKTFDLSNIEKSIVDAFFLPKNNDRAPNLNLDDKFLTQLMSRKIKSPTGKAGLRISITLVSKP